MQVKQIEINWHSGLTIFASEPFLRAVSDEYGWLGGVDDSGKLRCILPYTILRKAIFRMVRFRSQTIPVDEDFPLLQEKAFLNSAIKYFRLKGADMVIPGTTNTIFRTYPDGADAAPYGSYVIDLRPPEDILWKNIDRITRQNINRALKQGVSIRNGEGHIDAAYIFVRDTFRRAKLPFMSYESFERFVRGLGENMTILVADYEGIAQSYGVFAFSRHCAYAVYAGNISGQHQGANKLLYWEAIRLFRKLGVQWYDFVGARIDPERGTKQEALNLFKKRFGAKLIQGYMWKYSLHALKYRLYCVAAQLRSGGDIVDQERHKLARELGKRADQTVLGKHGADRV